MEMIDKFEILREKYDYIDYDGSLKGSDGNILDITGWAVRWGPPRKIWFLHGKRVTAMEVFESLSDKQKEEAIWELDEWV